MPPKKNKEKHLTRRERKAMMASQDQAMMASEDPELSELLDEYLDMVGTENPAPQFKSADEIQNFLIRTTEEFLAAESAKPSTSNSRANDSQSLSGLDPDKIAREENMATQLPSNSRTDGPQPLPDLDTFLDNLTQGENMDDPNILDIANLNPTIFVSILPEETGVLDNMLGDLIKGENRDAISVKSSSTSDPSNFFDKSMIFDAKSSIQLPSNSCTDGPKPFPDLDILFDSLPLAQGEQMDNPLDFSNMNAASSVKSSSISGPSNFRKRKAIPTATMTTKTLSNLYDKSMIFDAKSTQLPSNSRTDGPQPFPDLDTFLDNLILGNNMDDPNKLDISHLNPTISDSIPPEQTGVLDNMLGDLIKGKNRDKISVKSSSTSDSSNFFDKSMIFDAKSSIQLPSNSCTDGPKPFADLDTFLGNLAQGEQMDNPLDFSNMNAASSVKSSSISGPSNFRKRKAIPTATMTTKTLSNSSDKSMIFDDKSSIQLPSNSRTDGPQPFPDLDTFLGNLALGEQMDNPLDFSNFNSTISVKSFPTVTETFPTITKTISTESGYESAADLTKTISNLSDKSMIFDAKYDQSETDQAKAAHLATSVEEVATKFEFSAPPKFGTAMKDFIFDFQNDPYFSKKQESQKSLLLIPPQFVNAFPDLFCDLPNDICVASQQKILKTLPVNATDFKITGNSSSPTEIILESTDENFNASHDVPNPTASFTDLANPKPEIQQVEPLGPIISTSAQEELKNLSNPYSSSDLLSSEMANETD